MDEISGLVIVKILDGNTQYNVAKTEIHAQCSYFRHSQQWFRYHNISARRDVRDIRSKVFRLLQNQAGYIATEF